MGIVQSAGGGIEKAFPTYFKCRKTFFVVSLRGISTHLYKVM
ncbi:hypothetical protein DOT_0351 [Desulfosporosinus sp. OT]|nr:hypothetical protein DOT_0351 [Desulfosporosinus sp. OT]